MFFLFREILGDGEMEKISQAVGDGTKKFLGKHSFLLPKNGVITTFSRPDFDIKSPLRIT